jgi:transposase
LGRGDLSEAEWRILEELLPESRRKPGRPPENSRDVINGILWRLRTGAAWRDVPERYGDWNKIYRRFRRWNEAGVWKALATTLAEAMGDGSHHSIDSTTVRGHVSAAGAKGGLANRRLAARGAGSPVKVIVSVTPSADRSASTSPAAKRRTAKATTL